MAESPLAGRHALITGGGTGIGAAAAERLSAAGAKLSLLGRRMEPLQAVAQSHGGLVRNEVARLQPTAHVSRQLRATSGATTTGRYNAIARMPN